MKRTKEEITEQLMSYNELVLLFGAENSRVQEIRKHLNSINPNNNLDAEATNASLRAWSPEVCSNAEAKDLARKEKKADCTDLFNLCYGSPGLPII